MNLKDLSFTKEWTLFLDRDGVISQRLPGDYVTRWEDFRFLEGAMEALVSLSSIFGLIIIVSNQQGVGKGRMSQEELKIIDLKMKEEIRQAGGRIDAAYYSPYLSSENHPDRKPGTGMGLKAKADFPGIDFSRSIMIGDTESDMEFGKKLGMITVLISEDEIQQLGELADFHFRSLRNFASTLRNSAQ
jgi:histidinol-phosphate phosphatase family protein